MADIKRNFYGLQFHPEVHHTEKGLEILNNFVFNICKAKKNWKIENIIDDLIVKIKNQVAGKKVFLLVSGGVDSSVAFALLSKAIGKDNVYGLYIDTGFMRLNESKEIKKLMKKAKFDNLHVHKASQEFYNRLEKVSDPEKKRKIIGQTFLDVKDQVSNKLHLNSNEWILGQGTIYPDTIETGGTKHADTIKSHHNRVDAIQKLIDQGKVVEPIADFYKDEVRKLGKILGLPSKMINRHPFPGPGLAIRILCHKPSSNQSKINNITLSGIELPYAVLPIKSVGVQGDNRTYAHPLVVWGEQDWERLDNISSSITNTTKKINRVLLLTHIPEQDPSFKTLNKPKYLTQNRINLLQSIDNIVMQYTKNKNIYNDIWQFTVALLPVGNKNFESIVLRPVASLEAMTANFYRMPHTILQTITKKILATNKIDYVFYDITNKPPGTIEWE
jgi:GMP synthase (glutamine-hydrolysing)